MDNTDSVWLAADYHFPSTYSCRVPMSSMNSALAAPAPGPGTVRLALVRTGVELFGLDYVRDELFSVIRSTEVHISPPEHVAISTQLIRAYKANPGKSGKGIRLNESPVYREFAHATGLMTVYVKIPSSYTDIYEQLMEAIGYWGQATSFACCTRVYHSAPIDGECVVPLEDIEITGPTQNFFSCFISELRDPQVSWDDIIPGTGKGEPLRITLYVWPMVICERRSGGKILHRRSLVTDVAIGSKPHSSECLEPL